MKERPEHDSGRKLILVIDDSKIVNRIYELTFQKEPLRSCCELVVRENAQEGLMYLLSADHGEVKMPDLILLDWIMPWDMDGLDFLRRIKTIDNFKNIPVIMITSMNDKSKIEQAKREGLDDFIPKPIEVKTLTAAVRKFCGLPE